MCHTQGKGTDLGLTISTNRNKRVLLIPDPSGGRPLEKPDPVIGKETVDPGRH